jgi:serine/threonine protein kinase
METYTKIRNDPVDFAPNSSSASPELVDLLSGLLLKDPRRRLTLEEALRHPWTTSGSRRRSGR